jgi:cytochrome c553/uncharacterized protein (DUF302 family)
MKRALLSVIGAAVFLSGAASAADMANGQELARSCALCHGIFGQGTPGRLSPRIAGMPKEYLIKATKDYVEGKRNYPLMVRTSGLDKWTDKEFEDVATYLASLDLSSDRRFDIVARVGNPAAGEDIYKSDCRNCHNRDGYGKPSKEAPPLAGQHPEYLYTAMRGFKQKYRVHANDPEDDTFTDYADQDFINITAYLATLDDEKIVAGYRFTPPRFAPPMRGPRMVEKTGLEITDIKQTVVRMALEDGVTTEAAEEAMLAKADENGLKVLSQQRVSSFLSKQGVEMPHLAIYQFCDPMDARTMVMANPIFASYMPCRIAMVADEKGKLWLMMLNLDMLIDSQLLSSDVVETAVKVNQQMLDVMAAGAAGKK